MYNIEEDVEFLLSKAYQRGFALFRERLIKYGITPPQFRLMAFLWIKDGITQTELTEKSQVDRATMVGLVDRLEEEGMIKRYPQIDDRRAYRICLTEKGRALEGNICLAVSEATDVFTKKLTKSEKETLKKTLNKLRRE